MARARKSDKGGGKSKGGFNMFEADDHGADDGLVEDPNNMNNLCTACSTAKEPRGGKGGKAAAA